MIHRKRSPIKRFIVTFLARVFKLLFFAMLVLAVSYAWIWFRRDQRAVEITASPEAPPPPARAPDTLRLLTYNIAHARGPALNTPNDLPDREERIERLKAIGEAIRGLGLDIVFLQEVDFNTWWSDGVDQADIIAEAAGFPHIVRQRNYDTGLPAIRRYDFGNVLLSRFPIEEAEKIESPALSTWEDLFAGNHDSLAASIRISENRTIWILGAHLEYRSEDIRVEAAAELIRVQRQHSEPMILMGDLNSSPPGLPDSKTSATGQNAVELLESFGGFQRRPQRGRATHLDFTFPSEAPRRIIDWILPDRSWQILEYRVLRDVTYSDHLPVLSTVRFR